MFAEMPLDNRTVDNSRPSPLVQGFLTPFGMSPRSKRFNVSSWLAVL
jgi:hypothetical protein